MGDDHSPQLPLSDAHYRELFEQSGIGPEVLAAAGLYTCSDAGKLAKLRLKAKASWSAEYLPALVIPYRAIGKRDPIGHAAKPAKPMPPTEKGKGKGKGKGGGAAKYVRPYRFNEAYLPPSILSRPKVLDDEAVPLIVAEGEKKALAAESFGLSCCVGISGAHNWGAKNDLDLKELHAPLRRAAAAGKEAFLVFDSDARDNMVTVRRGEDELGRALTAEGATCYVVRLPDAPDGSKLGLDDYLVSFGADAFRQLMCEARDAGPVCTPDEAQRLRRPKVIVSTAEHVTTGMALQALARRRDMYARGGELVDVVGSDGKQAARIRKLPESMLRERLCESAEVVEPDGEGSSKHVHPPKWLLASVLERGEWSDFHALTGLVETAVIKPDGTILDAPGYDSDTGLYYAPIGESPKVPALPSPQDVCAARELLAEVFCDFPFRSPEHLSAVIAVIATMVVRFAFDGPAPLTLIEAPTAGSGKSQLARVASVIATGRLPADQQYTRDDDEQRKQITTIAREGQRVVVLDNLLGELGGAGLCSALTTTDWQSRLLRENNSFRGPLNAVWLATGNNVRLGEDMHRRVLHVRLEPREERPELRTDFRHPDLLGWVLQNQGRLLGAVLTMLRAYHVAGRPRVELQPWGSYEGWSHAVRAPLVWAGYDDPALGREDLIESACLADDAAVRTVRELNAMGGEHTAGELVREVYRTSTIGTPLDPHPELREALEELCPGGARPSAKSVGRALAKLRGRNLAGLLLEARTARGERKWFVRRAAQVSLVRGSVPANDDFFNPDDFVSDDESLAAEVN